MIKPDRFRDRVSENLLDAGLALAIAVIIVVPILVLGDLSP